MKKFATAALLAVIGYGGLHAAVDVKHLWEHKGSSHKNVKALWDRSRTSSAKPHASTTERIKDSQKTLQRTRLERAQANQQLEQIARSIQKAQLENIAISKVLDRLERELKKSESHYQDARKTIDQYGGKIQELDTTIRDRHARFVRLLSEQFSLNLVLQSIDRPTIDSVIQEEVYRAIKERNRAQLTRLKQEIDGSKHAKAKWVARQSVIQKSIRGLVAKRKLYQKKKKQKTKLLSQLAQKEKQYRTQIQTIMNRQESLRQTLSRLNILRKEEIQAARRAEAARREELKRKTAELKRLRQAQERENRQAKAEGRAVEYRPPTLPAPSAGTVKQYGSSYQADNIQTYRGRRTIAPLAHARVIKRFGTYIDPIYKIKIFNDNIVLKAPKTGAKVRNVLNGKVVYMGKNSMLGKVVVIEHGNRLHTIYAALERISPMLHTGARVKKGTIIGRIKRKLIFQATQNSKYINPLRLIRL